MQYFQVFKIESNYNIDLDLLTKRYLTLQKSLYNDIILNKYDIAELNHAYTVLKDDFLRLDYMLQCHKVKINDIDLAPIRLEAIFEMFAKISLLSSDKKEIAKKQLLNDILALIKKAATSMQNGDLHNAAQYFLEAKYIRKYHDSVK